MLGSDEDPAAATSAAASKGKPKGCVAPACLPGLLRLYKAEVFLECLALMEPLNDEQLKHIVRVGAALVDDALKKGCIARFMDVTTALAMTGNAERGGGASPVMDAMK